MSLDVFNPQAADQNVVQNAARDLPADFSEAFDVSTRAMTEWNSSLNFENARDRSLASFYDGVKASTGVQLPLYGMGGNVSLDDLNEAIAKLPQQPGDVEPSFAPLSEGSIRGMALERMRKAHGDAEAFAHRETSWSGTAGTVLGTLAGGVSDPVTLATLPLGGAGQLGIGARALEFAAIAGGTEAVIAGAGGPARVAAVPGSAKEIPGEIASATLFGGALGGGLGALSKLLGHGAKPLPTTVRDELNAASSEAQLNLTNPFPTAAGEAAARDAAIEATTRAVKGDPVTVADGFEARHVADYALAARSHTPEELAIAGEKHLRPETYGLAPDVERFDRMPAEADDAASYWDKRLEAATPEERAALGATDTQTSKTFPDHEYSVVGYHGTNDVISKFDPQKTRLGRGVFFSDTPELANKFAHGLAVDGDAAHFPDEPGFLDWIRPHVSDKEFKAISETHAKHDAAMAEMSRHEIDSPGYIKAQDEYTALSNDLNLEAKKVSAFIDHETGDFTKAPNVTPVRLRLGKTHEVDMGGKFDWDVERDAINYARKNGFDSVTLKNVGEGDSKIYSILDAENIKPKLIDVSVPDLTPEQLTRLAADPATDAASLHNLEHIIAEKPDLEFSTQIRQPDGSYQLATRKLSDVLGEIDGLEAAGRELEACAAGLALAAE